MGQFDAADQLALIFSLSLSSICFEHICAYSVLEISVWYETYLISLANQFLSASFGPVPRYVRMIAGLKLK